MTDRAAIPGISAHGLLSAAALCHRHGQAQPATLRHNRTAWMEFGSFALRRQGMSDFALSTRLAPSLDPVAWRMFINGLVFLFPSLAAARRLRWREPARDQVVLQFDTVDVMAVAPLLVCRFNNGFADRTPAGPLRRLRCREDYTPIHDWPGTPVAEVAATGAISPAPVFTVLSPP